MNFPSFHEWIDTSVPKKPVQIAGDPHATFISQFKKTAADQTYQNVRSLLRNPDSKTKSQQSGLSLSDFVSKTAHISPDYVRKVMELEKVADTIGSAPAPKFDWSATVTHTVDGDLVLFYVRPRARRPASDTEGMQTFYLPATSVPALAGLWLGTGTRYPDLFRNHAVELVQKQSGADPTSAKRILAYIARLCSQPKPVPKELLKELAPQSD